VAHGAWQNKSADPAGLACRLILIVEWTARLSSGRPAAQDRL
jgi:hypothetical protein